MFVVKNVKSNFDVSTFKKTGKVVATLQVSAGKDVRYTFKCPSATVNEVGEMFLSEEGEIELLDCQVYIPSTKQYMDVDSNTVLYQLLANAKYNHFYDTREDNLGETEAATYYCESVDQPVK